MRTVEWDPKGVVRMIDQRLLPLEFVVLELADPAEVAEAIEDMAIRGAPAIGAAAAFGLALAARQSRAGSRQALMADLERAAALLRATRPTAVNLFWAVDRMLRCARGVGENGPQAVVEALVAEAQRIADEDVEINRRIGAHGADLVEDGFRILTHCNAGALATVDYGTALAVVRENDVSVYREPKVYSAVIATVNGGRYVVAEKAKDKLVAVRMADGAVGWVKPECLRILDMPSDPPVGALEDLNLPDFEPRGRKPIYAGGNSIISRAYRYLGIPYVWGGTSDRGLDCSGFVQRVFAEEGIRLPRVAVDQAGVGMAVDRRSLQPGDRVYFQSGHEIDHTGIYIGGGQFVHAENESTGVKVSDINSDYYSSRWYGAVRLS
mgnify:CR=1 FL=1